MKTEQQIEDRMNELKNASTGKWLTQTEKDVVSSALAHLRWVLE